MMKYRTQAAMLAVLFLLSLVGCQATQPPMYVINRENYFDQYPYGDFSETVARSEYEGQGNPKYLPVAVNEAAWTAEGEYCLAFHDSDEWRELAQRFDPLIQALYIWNSPANRYADAQAQLTKLEPLLDPDLYRNIVDSGYYQKVHDVFEAIVMKSEVHMCSPGPYCLAFTDGQGRRIVRYVLSTNVSARKIGDYDIPPEYYDEFPYYVRGDAGLALYVYVEEASQKIIQVEEVYLGYYWSRAFTGGGMVVHDVYPGYAYYLNHMVNPVHTLPDEEQTLASLDAMLYAFTGMLYDDGGAGLSREALERFCTPALLARLDDEAYVQAHNTLLQNEGVAMRCEEILREFNMPLRSYVTKEGAAVMLLETRWRGVITLPEGTTLPERDGNLKNSDVQMYRTSYYIVYQDGQYLIDEFMTHDYFKS